MCDVNRKDCKNVKQVHEKLVEYLKDGNNDLTKLNKISKIYNNINDVPVQNHIMTALGNLFSVKNNREKFCKKTRYKYQSY